MHAFDSYFHRAQRSGAFREATGRCVFGNPAQVGLGRDLKTQRQLGLPSVALLLVPHPCQSVLSVVKILLLHQPPVTRYPLRHCTAMLPCSRLARGSTRF